MNIYVITFPFKGSYHFIEITANQLANGFIEHNDDFISFTVDSDTTNNSDKAIASSRGSEELYNELLEKYESLKSEYDKIVEERDHLLEKEVQKKELNTIIKKDITFNNGATSSFNVYEEDGITKGLIYSKLEGSSAEEDMRQVYALMYGMELLGVENYSLGASSDNNEDSIIFLTCTDGEYLVPVCPEEYRKVDITTNTEEVKTVTETLSIKTQLP